MIDVLHHLGLVTRDMERTVGQYERIGFRFTPLSLPRIPLSPGGEPQLLGVGNRTAIFENNYLEVLAVTDADRWSRVPVGARGPFDIDPPLARYEGLHVLHFGTDDLSTVRARYEREGIASSPIRPFQRPVETEGGVATMRAQSLFFPPGTHPEALVQIAQHLTPELVLQPRFMNHPNGARSLIEVLVCVEDPRPLAERYARETGAPVETGRGAFVVSLPRGAVTVTDVAGVRARIPGFVPPIVPHLSAMTVAVRALDTVHAALGGVPCVDVDGRLLVRAADAGGVNVFFEVRDVR